MVVDEAQSWLEAGCCSLVTVTMTFDLHDSGCVDELDHLLLSWLACAAVTMRVALVCRLGGKTISIYFVFFMYK